MGADPHGQSTTSRLFWPSPQDYNEAVQTPTSSFADAELRQGSALTNALGLPRCVSGNFASVFCFQCPDRQVAVRCFLHNVPDQHERYSAISRYVLGDDLACTVACEYLEEGIKIHGDWYPILKMQWVSGQTLNQFLTEHLNNGMALNLLASYFKEMTLELKRRGIAHGDLQHDNIMISDDELRLVDYDGMYVPELAGRSANELGHVNYQHPGRTANYFDAGLDNFSDWVIFGSLKALSRDPSLWQQLEGGADCILFRRADFLAPAQSSAFQVLERHGDERVRGIAYILRHLLEMPIADVPPLDLSISELLSRSGSIGAARTNGASPLPDWFDRRSLEAVVDCGSPYDTASGAQPEPDQRGRTRLKEAQPAPHLVVDGNSAPPLLVGPSPEADDPYGILAGPPPLSGTTYPPAPVAVSATPSPAAASSRSHCAPRMPPPGFPADSNYPWLNRLQLSRTSSAKPEETVKELRRQLLPGEQVKWAGRIVYLQAEFASNQIHNLLIVGLISFMMWMASAGDAAGNGGLTTIFLVTLILSALTALAQFAFNSLHRQPASQANLPTLAVELAAPRAVSQQVLMVTNKRIVIAIATSVHSIPLFEIAAAQPGQDLISLVLKPKGRFRMPDGRAFRALCIGSDFNTADELIRLISAEISAAP